MKTNAVRFLDRLGGAMNRAPATSIPTTLPQHPSIPHSGALGQVQAALARDSKSRQCAIKSSKDSQSSNSSPSSTMPP